MAREVIVMTWCDVCLAEDVQEDATELPPLLIPELGTKPRTMALCEVHLKEVYEPLVSLLREHGQMVDADGNHTGPRGKYKKAGKSTAAPAASSPAAADEDGCPVDGCDYVAPNRSSLRSHVRRRHDVTLSELLGEEQPYECPECGLKSSRPQGLAAHRRKVHGVLGATAKKQEESGGEALFEDAAPKPAKKSTRKKAAAR